MCWLVSFLPESARIYIPRGWLGSGCCDRDQRLFSSWNWDFVIVGWENMESLLQQLHALSLSLRYNVWWLAVCSASTQERWGDGDSVGEVGVFKIGGPREWRSDYCASTPFVPGGEKYEIHKKLMLCVLVTSKPVEVKSWCRWYLPRPRWRGTLILQLDHVLGFFLHCVCTTVALVVRYKTWKQCLDLQVLQRICRIQANLLWRLTFLVNPFICMYIYIDIYI